MADAIKDRAASHEQRVAAYRARRDMEARVKMESPPAFSSNNYNPTRVTEHGNNSSENMSRTPSESASHLRRFASPSAAESETTAPAPKKALTSRERRNQECHEAYQLARAAGVPATSPSALNMLEVAMNAEITGSGAAVDPHQGPRRSSYNDPTFSDVTLQIVETIHFVYAHKVILAQCELILQWMTSPPMTNNVLMLDNECGSPLALQILMHFVYDNRYETKTGDTTMSSDWSDFSNHAEVYTFATQKGLVELQDAVVARMTAWNRPWVPMPKFARALRLIWTSPLQDDDVLQPRLTLLCLRNLKDLATFPAFRQVMEDTPFEAAIALATISDDRGQRSYLLMAGGASALNKRSASPSTPTSSGYNGREEQPDRCTSIAQTTDESSIVAKYTSVATSNNSARSSDLTVIIRGEKIRAHRIKLDECPFFERMLSRTAQDAAVVNLDTSEASPIVVKGFLCFLYRGQYDVDEIDDVPAPEWDATSLHAEVYVLACKYTMVELAQVAAIRLTSWTRPLSDLTELFHTLHVLWMSDFEDRHELRQFFVGDCLPVVRTLMPEAWFKELMRRTELGADIAIALAAREKGERRDFIRYSEEEEEGQEDSSDYVLGRDLDACLNMSELRWKAAGNVVPRKYEFKRTFAQARGKAFAAIEEVPSLENDPNELHFLRHSHVAGLNFSAEITPQRLAKP
ncbi:hypothetical protein B0A48_17087 [Cryoendolithus antarcticus]|uniref:BTB domain-containing protein n=1 Tax=Cryoendolithus antarcticus TaxID=1507870 RepID=A0A1V8SBC6_9PEZI|nr:hypothetical protein B0A48_17087 [Cryoendolithus antarcticus]